MYIQHYFLQATEFRTKILPSKEIFITCTSNGVKIVA